MNRIVIVLAVGIATPALAADWGKADDPTVCHSTSTQGQIHYEAKCQAAIDKLVPNCIADPSMKDKLAKAYYVDGKNTSPFDKDKGKPYPEDAKDICEAEALDRIKKQEEQGDVEKTELPEAKMKNPALEKAVAAAFQKDYGDTKAKVLKVILDGWSDDLEKDSFGRVTGRDLSATVVQKMPDGKCVLHEELWMQHGNGKSYSGPLSARGAGSWKDTEILCSKVETGAAGAAAKKKSK